MVLDALAAAPDPVLRDRLGPERHDWLDHLLRERALAWARRAGAGAEPLRARAAGELGALTAGHDGPVVLLAPDVPGLSEAHLAAARDDLAAGVLISTGPTGDGTPFLMVLGRPEPRLLALAGGATFDELVAAAVDVGGTLGMLRPERRLATLADARAIRADPLAPAELVEALAGLG
ncbi:hypothetical protein FSW04_07790 [Baekduia soli]|uniref:2-phospho-L-lactate guanylyltransferase n=1 Tax=Baekduia soli TaxID=496014 RepID=A0A5B8U354_9ACTN|nr:hypothetical protein [Baekduia soli]QEC47489.1 hypothetical protein FSW04_07790 [Baekduia soli]